MAASPLVGTLHLVSPLEKAQQREACMHTVPNSLSVIPAGWTTQRCKHNFMLGLKDLSIKFPNMNVVLRNHHTHINKHTHTHKCAQKQNTPKNTEIETRATAGHLKEARFIKYHSVHCDMKLTLETERLVGG